MPPRPLISTQDIAARVAALGSEIAARLPDGALTAVGVLRGAFIFMADLVRAIPRDVRCDFLGVRSYGAATETSGVVQIISDLTWEPSEGSHTLPRWCAAGTAGRLPTRLAMPISGQHVLLVEDIVDTGLTLRYLLDLLQAQGPASLHVCTLLNKPSRRRVEVPLHFVGFEIPDRFVVGYGLDVAQQYRNLPYVAVVDE